MFIASNVCAKLPQSTMSLKQFMLRREAILLYRNILRQAQRLPDKNQRKEIRDWTRAEFEMHRHQEKEEVIKQLIFQGKKQLEQLEVTVKLANS
ncbi:LYR motif-containing protein 2-like [Macrobrachium nipponense]|uniref:LYR motif-containing protein 2-like n=1 Tax=Macrobrachium nipponense TaxID=159736 RepID=UPI0030C89893